MDKIQSYKKLIRNLRLEKEKHKTLVRTGNYTQTNIKEFTIGHTIYLRKMVSGYSHFVLCKFVKIEKGIVTGTPIAVDPEWATRTYFTASGEAIQTTARLKNCCLRDLTGIYHWFNKQGFAE